MGKQEKTTKTREKPRKKEGKERKCEKKGETTILISPRVAYPNNLLMTPLLMSPNAGRETYSRCRSFCQGALSGFHLATLLLFSLKLTSLKSNFAPT